MAKNYSRPTKDMTPEELDCHKAQVKARQRAYQKEWRRKNASRYYELQRLRRKNNPKYSEWAANWREKNRNRLNTKAREWAKKNKESNKARFLKYLNKTRAQRYEEWAYRQAIKKGCAVYGRDRLVEMYQRAIDLTKQTGVRWSVDHIISMSFGGPHCPDNCQPMPVKMNASKSGNPFWVSEDGSFKDWRSVPMSIWPPRFRRLYDGVVSHATTPILTRTA
jgi:hypothetical protein